MWEFNYFGTQTNSNDDGYEEFEDGSVRVFSVNGAGKVVPKSTDGVAFYYQKLPVGTNFKLCAKACVNKWSFSNGQEGFGLLACDRVGHGGRDFWNNSVMTLITEHTYFWDEQKRKVTINQTKSMINMSLGVSAIRRTGVSKDNLSEFVSDSAGSMRKYFTQQHLPMETLCADRGSGCYNLLGNMNGHTPGEMYEGGITEFKLTMQKYNGGMRLTYIYPDGYEYVRYFRMADDEFYKIDESGMYVGLFAARHADVTFKDIVLETYSADEDTYEDDYEPQPGEMCLLSGCGMRSNTPDYELLLYYQTSEKTDAVPYITLKSVESGETVYEGDMPPTGFSHIKLKLDIGENHFTAHAECQGMHACDMDICVTYCTYADIGEVIYVSPEGTSDGDGSKDKPIDLYTAVMYPAPGQTILLQPGHYRLNQDVVIDRGINGREEAPIVLKGSEAGRAVLDFCASGGGIMASGNSWHLTNFDVTNSCEGRTGITLTGSNCRIEKIDAYKNRGVGICVRALTYRDEWEDRPHNVTVFKCRSHDNSMIGYKDADGFSAKITVGKNILLKECIAYHNADDGFDLYNKAESGMTGPVILEDCIAYSNGFVRETGIDGKTAYISAGNGNGFKMGGESVDCEHIIKGSLAFNNKAIGFDANTCPGMSAYDCVAYNNYGANVAFYTGNAEHTHFKAQNVISYKTADFTEDQYEIVKDCLESKGNQCVEDFINDTTQYIK